MRLEMVGVPERSWRTSSSPRRPWRPWRRWLWSICSANVDFPQSSALRLRITKR
jgi:hypothetical protein